MYSNKFRRLRPLASASPAQTAQPLLPELRLHPPPKRTTEGIATMCAAELPPIFGPSQTRGLCPYPQAQGLRKPVVAYGNSVVQFESDLYRQKSYSEFLEREKKKEARCPQRQHPSQEKSASPEKELKDTKAPNANRVQLKSKEPEALERKVSELKIKREEMALTEPEEPEEENSNSEEMDLPETEDSEEIDRVMDLEENITWHHKNDMDEFYENNEVIKCYQYKIVKMKEKADRIKKDIMKNGTIIKERQLGLKSLQVILEKNPNHDIYRMKIKQISEKLAKVYEKCYGHFGCPEFLFSMMIEFEEWSFDCSENTPAETLHKQQMEFWKDYYKNIRLQKQAELDALKEERWQRRREQALERALAPPVKTSGKKLMPHSPPPKKVVKKVKPVETRNQE